MPSLIELTLQTSSMTILFANLGPEIKIFIGSALILGPVAVGLLLLTLKKIEKDNPNKIRWK